MAELQVFSCYRGQKEACQAMRVISTTWRCELSSGFFRARQGAERDSHHSDRNIRATCTIICRHQKLGGPVYFKCGDFSTCDAPCPGPPKTVTTPEIIDQIHELILEDHWILAKSVAEELGLLCEWVGSIVHEDLDMKKLSAKWVPKFLNADQKRQQCQSSEQLLEFFWRNPNDFLLQLVTLDETWLYHYDPETKQQSMEWWHSGSPHPKKFQVQKSAEKFWP